MIRYDIDLALFGVAAARRHLVEADPQAQFALSLFPEAEQLTQLARSKRPATSRASADLKAPPPRLPSVEAGACPQWRHRFRALAHYNGLVPVLACHYR